MDPRKRPVTDGKSTSKARGRQDERGKTGKTRKSLEDRIAALEAAVASLEYWRTFRDREEP